MSCISNSWYIDFYRDIEYAIDLVETCETIQGYRLQYSIEPLVLNEQGKTNISKYTHSYIAHMRTLHLNEIGSILVIV